MNSPDRRSPALLACLLLAPAAVAADEATEALRAELDALEARLAVLEARLAEREAGERAVRPEAVAETETDATREAEENAAPPAGVEFGGAVRLNYRWRDFDSQLKDRYGELDFELFRVNMDGRVGDVGLSAEYRWYPDFDAVHHGYFSYAPEGLGEFQLGVTQVPFGLLPYASHSYWFGATYYMGFEDDYDGGLKWVYANGPWDAQLAFYKNPEYTDDSRYGRYSFDVATGGEQFNEESNQINARLAYEFRHREDWSTTLGASLQVGQLYNQATRKDGDRYAFAAHANGRYGPWNLQLQFIDYEFAPENPPGVADDFVQIAGFDVPFLMAADGRVYTLNLARDIDFHWGPVDGLTCYNDYSHVAVDGPGRRDSIQNVTGCLVVAGGLYTYVDWIAGKNMWFAGGPGIGLDDDQWRSRLNINLGFYF